MRTFNNYGCDDAFDRALSGIGRTASQRHDEDRDRFDVDCHFSPSGQKMKPTGAAGVASAIGKTGGSRPPKKHCCPATPPGNSKLCIAAMLHQQLVTWRMLREVVEETDLLEKETAKLQAEEKRQREAVKPQAVVKHEERKEEHKNVAKPQTDAKHDEVEVNVEELKRESPAATLGFRTLESELDEKDAWDAASLTPLMDRLKVLVSAPRRPRVVLRFDAEAQRSSVGRLEAPQGVISQLAAKISEARKQASGDEFSGSATERQAELDRLESLSRRLAELERK